MSLPPLLSSSRSGVCTCGDVVLQQGVALAPGVVLVADPGSLLVIETGACIGKEAILHATGGELRIEAGSILGAGVLVVGKGKIGSRATVGTCATLLEPTVAEGSVIAPGEIVGGFGEPQPAALTPVAVVGGSSPPLPLASGPPIQDLLGPTVPVAAPLLPPPLTLPLEVAGGSSPPLPLASGPPIQTLQVPVAPTIALPESPKPEVQVVTLHQDSPGLAVHVVAGLTHFNRAEGPVIAVEKIADAGLPPPVLVAEVANGGSPPPAPPVLLTPPVPAEVGSDDSSPPAPPAPGPVTQVPQALEAPAVEPPEVPEPAVQAAPPPPDAPVPTAHVVTGMAHFARLKVLLMGNNGR